MTERNAEFLDNFQFYTVGHPRGRHTALQHRGRQFLPGFVPKACIDERLQGAGTALNEQALHILPKERFEHEVDVGKTLPAAREFSLGHAPQDHGQRVGSVPGSHRQTRAVKVQRAVSHKDGLMPRPLVVHRHLSERGGEYSGLLCCFRC